jgi:hypothetical protein
MREDDDCDFLFVMGDDDVGLFAEVVLINRDISEIRIFKR